MSQSHADALWNRAVLEGGGVHPKAGDSALAALLLAHGYIMNGGVLHAIEGLSREELAAAVEGYSYFGLSAVADVLTSAAQSPPSQWTDDSAEAADHAYWEQVPDDGSLIRAFVAVLRERPSEFAEIAAQQRCSCRATASFDRASVASGVERRRFD
jgi:hypothetical protein